MSAAARFSDWQAVRPLSLTWLAASVLLLSYLSGFPAGLGLVFAPVALVVSVVFRSGPWRQAAPYGPLPALFVLVLEAAFAPVGFGTELLAGLAGIAFLVWLADDPARPSGGPRRAFPSVAVPALALGLAWSSALFLPAGALPIGVGGALLAFTLAAVAFLVGRPTLFDREEG